MTAWAELVAISDEEIVPPPLPAAPSRATTSYETGEETILIIDDEHANILLLTHLLRQKGYSNLFGITDPREALTHFDILEPDLVILDLHMPHMSGFEVLEYLTARNAVDTYLPVLVLTGDSTGESRNRALACGAHDFLAKPFDLTEAQCRIRNLLHTRGLHRKLESENVRLEEMVQVRTRELEEAHMQALERLAAAAEFRDDETGRHTKRVGDLSALLAESLGMSPVEVAAIRRAAPLHDVGKIGIPDSILLKPGSLTPEEFATMRTHPIIGAQLLAAGRAPVVRMAEQIALSHHERWDGTGYPHGRKAEEIPLVARIVALADFYDALSHDRPYRKAWPQERVLDEISSQTGKHFDPGVVEAFTSIRHLLPGDQPMSG